MRLACIVLVFLNVKYAYSSDTDGFHYCIETNTSIKNTSLCDNKIDCLHGSDESAVLCKRVEPQYEILFQCANGFLISDQGKCDGKYNCTDRSDESVNLCSNELHDKEMSKYNEIRKGICSEYV